MRKWEPLRVEDTKDIITPNFNLNPEAISIIQLLTKKKSSFLQQRSQGTQTHSRSIQNELKGGLFCFVWWFFFFLFFSSHNALSGHFFPYKSFAYVLEFPDFFMNFLCERISVLPYLCVFLVSFLWFLFALFAYLSVFGTVLFFILFVCWFYLILF